MRVKLMALGLVFGVIAATVAPLVPGARAATADRIDVTEYGIYSSTIAKAEPSTAQGIRRATPKNIRLKATTRNVPLQKGIEFGFRYKVAGTPKGAETRLRIVIRYPAPGVHPPGAADPILRTEYSKTVKLGKSQFLDYAFEEDWELVPGDWIFEIWQGDQKLTEQVFTMTR